MQTKDLIEKGRRLLKDFKEGHESFKEMGDFMIEHGEVLLSRLEKRTEACEFYAKGNHFEYCGEDSFEPETVSGEPENWLCGGNCDNAFQYEDGFVAREALDEDGE